MNADGGEEKGTDRRCENESGASAFMRPTPRGEIGPKVGTDLATSDQTPEHLPARVLYDTLRIVAATRAVVALSGGGERMIASTKALTEDESERAASLRQLESHVARRSVERLREQFAKSGDPPSLEEIEDMLDKTLGPRPIGELLDEVRGKY
ncbi:MAG: hypothetical protein HY332_23385 [Chloroflexi bacterium]|nr:hypothetical protein [Chloroflexota bacterium]